MTKLEAWIEKKRHNECSTDDCEMAQAIAVIEKLKGVVHHVAKKEHKPWLKKCLENALNIDPEKL